MLSENEYNKFLKKVSLRFIAKGDYSSYCKFENDWLTYYEDIFIKNYNPNKPPRIFIAESAPEGSYPNKNYLFDKANLTNLISEASDMFLYRYYRGIFSNSSPGFVKKLDKRTALVHLAQENILIIDLLPTHGIKLSSSQRISIRKFITECDFSKLLIFSKFKSINYCFSIPPSLYIKSMVSSFLGKNFIEFSNVNAGQGHAPSIIAIKNIVQQGF